MRQLSPQEILESALRKAHQHLDDPIIAEPERAQTVGFVCRQLNNRAGVRLLLACSLAKIHQPNIDIRKPYTELGAGSYSGRSYDETYVTAFTHRHNLPCNPTTAFLTPALRTKPILLEQGTNLGGRPRELYEALLDLFDDIEHGRLSAEDVLIETLRCLLLLKQEREERMRSLLGELDQAQDAVPLSSEEIVILIQQHISLPRSSRLPVLVVAAAYQSALDYLRERVLPLESHTAADEQTKSLGDIEVTLIGEDRVVTTYEMKLKPVTIEDIDRALQKIRALGSRVDNYIFITTEGADESAVRYAESLYRQTGGIEFAILDCIGFLRHFLHLFHRVRLQFLDAYQELVLAEPESAVRQPLKEAFLALRRAAESVE